MKVQSALERYSASPLAFLDDLYVPTGRGPRRFGDIMADFQRDRFKILAPSLIAVARGESPPATRFWIEATKGASKDSDLACCLLWLLMASRRTLRIEIGAYDAKQADEIRLIVKQILKIAAPLNSILAQFIEVQADKFFNVETESAAEILTRDSKGGHGSRPDVVLINELSHIGDKEFAETLADNLDKIPDGILIVATNAGFIPSWQAEWKAAARDSGFLFHEYAQPAPWITEAALAGSRRRNPPQRYARLWEGAWCANGGDALAEDDIQGAATLLSPLAAPEPGWVYTAGLDLGITRDASALAIIGRHIGHFEPGQREERPPPPPAQLAALIDLGIIEQPEQLTNSQPAVYVQGTGLTKLADLQVWRPKSGGIGGGKVDLESIERCILLLHQRFKLNCIGADPWEARYLIERLRKLGSPIEAVDQVPANLKSMCEVVLSAFQERTLSIYQHPALIADLRNLRAVDRGYWVRLESPKSTGAGDQTGHGDTTTALAIALHVSRKYASIPLARIEGPLICWP